MPEIESRSTSDQIASRGGEFFEQRVRPKLGPEDDGKFVAIDVGTGDYEIDEDDYAAVMRLRSRNPVAEIWLARAGFPATCRIGSIR